jgi:serine/threonine protein kinase
MSVHFGQVNNEVKILAKLQHPAIIPYLNTCTCGSATVLVLPWAEGGSLFDLVSQRGPLCEDIVCRMARTLLRAVAYLHSICIWHRDIKPDNVLIVNRDFSGDNCVLADFGSATYLGLDHRVSCGWGTPLYASPEVRTGELSGLSTDMWGVGVTVLEALLGHMPFPVYGNEVEQGMDWVAKKCDLSSFSDMALDLLWRMVEPDPERRIRADEALKHPWFGGIHDD